MKMFYALYDSFFSIILFPSSLLLEAKTKNQQD